MSFALADRMRLVDASGIRRIFDLAAKLDNPINLSIGQPDFDVPSEVRETAIRGIRAGRNRYTVTQGVPELRRRIAQELSTETGRPITDSQVLVTSGVSGGLMLAMTALVNPGDEVLIPDPYFVIYKALTNLLGGRGVYLPTYPDFRLSPAAVEAALTDRTKVLLLNSPGNPTGAVIAHDDMAAILAVCRHRGVLVIADEIYDRFCYDGPFPAALTLDGGADNVLLVRGFSKTYAMTGWRLGYAAGPTALINAMTMLQQYTFVCAPSMVQYAGITALDTDMAGPISEMKVKRDLMRQRLAGHFEIAGAEGAFYLFPRAPGGSGTAFVEAALAEKVLVIPGGVFSEADTHFRISYATDTASLERGAEILCRLAERFKA